MAKRPTMADVARAAGVAIGTVANVLNGTASVRAETRERVERAILELRYRRAGLARSAIALGGGRERQQRPPAPQLTAVGYLSVDYTARVAVLPHRDDRITAAGIAKSLGGPAANVAVMAAGLGDPYPVEVALVTTIGDDPDSDWALSELAAKHVDTIAVRRRPGQRLSRCIVLVEPNGSRTIINEPFALEEADLARYLGEPPAPGRRHCVHMEGYQLDRMAGSVATLKAGGWRTSLQTTGLPAAWRNRPRFATLRRLFDVVFLNREAARDITECRSSTGELIRATATLVRSDVHGGMVVLTLGEGGAMLFMGDGRSVSVPARPVEVVDRTGAGDTFAGVFLGVWLNTDEPVEAARWAAVAASMTVAAEGAQGSIQSAAALAGLVDEPRRQFRARR